VNIIRIALIAPQEKDRQQLREQMFSYAVRWKVAVVTDCFDCLEEFAMAAQSGGYQLVCLRGGERQWRAAEELRRIRGEGETLWAYLEEGQALRAKVLTAADTFGAVEWRRVSGMNTVMTDYFALAPPPAREASHAIKVAIDEALKCKETGEEKTIVFGLAGTGYFDMVGYEKLHNKEMTDYIPSDEDLKKGFDGIPRFPGNMQ